MLRSMICTAIAGTVMVASTSIASPVFVGHVTFNDSYGSTNGGEFRATGGADWAINAKSTGTAFQGGIAAQAGMFETFCLERFEGLEFGNSDYKGDVNTETTAQDANYAAGNHGGFNDPLDPRTAYLYHHFLAQTLTTPYDYVNEANRIADANAMQEAIWFLEGEYDSAATVGGKSAAFIAEAEAAIAGGSWSGIGNVRVLNVYTNTARGDWQDVIVELVAIPLPGTSMMAGAGLLGLATIRRRK